MNMFNDDEADDEAFSCFFFISAAMTCHRRRDLGEAMGQNLQEDTFIYDP